MASTATRIRSKTDLRIGENCSLPVVVLIVLEHSHADNPNNGLHLMLEVVKCHLGSSDVLVLLLEVFPVDDQFHSTSSFFLGWPVLEEPQARVRRLLDNGYAL